MRRVQVVEAKAHFSSLLAEVEAGATVVITRHGKVVARLVPDAPRMASELFEPCWPDAADIDLVAPADPAPEPVAGL
jgi:prevent-host-death family protein